MYKNFIINKIRYESLKDSSRRYKQLLT